VAVTVAFSPTGALDAEQDPDADEFWPGTVNVAVHKVVDPTLNSTDPVGVGAPAPLMVAE
jgi:hypothetical protein